MDTTQIIVALATVITTLAGYIAMQFKAQLAAKDEQLKDKDKQIERWQTVATTNGDTTRETLTIVKDLQGGMDAFIRDYWREVPKRTTRTRE